MSWVSKLAGNHDDYIQVSSPPCTFKARFANMAADAGVRQGLMAKMALWLWPTMAAICSWTGTPVLSALATSIPLIARLTMMTATCELYWTRPLLR